MSTEISQGTYAVTLGGTSKQFQSALRKIRSFPNADYDPATKTWTVTVKTAGEATQLTWFADWAGVTVERASTDDIRADYDYDTASRYDR